MAMNTLYRKQLPGTQLDYFDASEAVNALQPAAWATLPYTCLLYTSPSPRDQRGSRMPSSA